ncbi:M23 family metallopeptidase [Heyndrickxia coagulans]|uniref:M23 family metallopeptidase n=1 Tax=Heyndrickxia coagulans TaxID=1398 RepID=UPI0018A73B82|nr:M23 family metallopeptidase [Heyndrickxia coagulans]MBF8419413.1 M23 family metallopeptidase [Heyndrickxia coagulans]
MGNRADEIRRQMAKRRKTMKQAYNGKETVYASLIKDEGTHVYEPPGKTPHPLFKKETVLFKILASACLVLAVAILFKSERPEFDKPKAAVKQVMVSEFQFAKAAAWYEKKFGKPVALFPEKSSKTETAASNEDPQYAMPVSGKVLTSFTADGRGVTIETKPGASVKAMSGGTVIFAGKKPKLGNTVIIQHADSTETWYANLSKIDVGQYDSLKTGEKVGTARSSGEKGEFYFALKKDGGFIDPIQVIKFE